MRLLIQDLRELDRRSWIVIGVVAGGNLLLLLGGLADSSPTFSLVVLAVTGFIWVVFLQLTRRIMQSSLQLADDAHKGWQAEADFAREILDEQLRTIHDLKQYDLQASGLHLERLRRTLVARHPELENVIAEVEHPLNVPGLII